MSRTPALSPIVPLAPTHAVGAFACGDADIDDFIHRRASTEQAARLSQVYVTVGTANNVLGYFTLSPITVRVETSLLAALGLGDAPYAAIGGFLLGRLGVDSSLQRRGIGEALVMRAAQIAKREAELVGGAFLAVDPKTDELVTWYARLDFVRLGTRTRQMVLSFGRVPGVGRGSSRVARAPALAVPLTTAR